MLLFCCMSLPNMLQFSGKRGENYAYKEILTQALSSTILKDENLQAIAAQLIHDTCCQAVLEIQAILADDTRTDKDCFYQIEKIVCALQDKGIFCGNRHDFG